jgi:hypothetical protein
MNQEEYTQTMQTYIELKNEKETYQQKIRELNERIQFLETQLTPMISKNPLKIDINGMMFNIEVKKRKQYSGITFRYLENCLGQIIEDEEQLKHVIKHIKNNREVSEVEKIIMTANN